MFTLRGRPQSLSMRLNALALLTLGALLGTSAGASAQTVTYLPGSRQEFKVPAGVTSVEVTAVGGEGERGTQCRNVTGSGAGAGGSGALVTANVPVSGAKALYIDFGAGGPGGTGGGAEPCSLDGGAGGSSSEVLSEASAPLVVAGGGGGGGASFGFGEPSEEESTNGGVGASASSGVANGGNGVSVYGPNNKQEEGGGGEGGAPNSPGAGGSGESNVAAWATAATIGGLATGGDGGSWNGISGSPFVAAGGGGGGGHYGGGGGGTGNVDAGGGGAGSSFIDESVGATGTVASGVGQPLGVTISYTATAPPTTRTVTTPASVKATATQVAETPVQPAAAPNACVSLRQIVVHARRHVSLPAGTKIVHTDVLLAGRLVARLRGANPAAQVSFVGMPKRAYTVTILARTSSGKLVKASAIYHTCTSGHHT